MKQTIFLLMSVLALSSCKKEPSIEMVGVTAVPDYTHFTCDVIKEMAIANINNNVSDPSLDVVLEACKEKERHNAEGKQVVMAVYNPQEGKYFYGMVHPSDLENVEEECHNIGGAAAFIASAGDPDLTMTLYKPGGRACQSIVDALMNENPLVIINPVAVIAGEELKYQGKKILEKLDVYDDYQDATKALDEAARNLHNSFNEDLKSVTSWVKEDKERAAKYIAFGGVQAAVEIIEKHHEKVEAEAKRVAEDVIQAPKKVLDQLCYSKCKIRHGSNTCKNRCLR